MEDYEDVDDSITFDNNALNEPVGGIGPVFEGEHYKLIASTLEDSTVGFLVARLNQLPNITPRARTKIYNIITTFYAQKVVVTNYTNQKEINVANLNLDIAIEELYLSLDAWDVASNDVMLIIDLIRAGYHPTVLRGKDGFAMKHVNLATVRSVQEVLEQPRAPARKRRLLEKRR